MPQNNAPDLAPVIACERTATGWRGLTKDGEILNVTAHVNGSPVVIPKSVAMTRGDEIVSYHAIESEPSDGVVADYVRHLDASTALLRKNDATQALAEIDVALTCASTVLARYNRAMILLHLERWQEGFDEYAYCEENSPLFKRPQWAAAIERGDLCPWCGDNLAGKKLLLIHDHGLGDTIMMLRFVPQLQAMGAEVVLQVPPALERLAAQLAPVTRELVDADYICSMLMLMAYSGRGATPQLMPNWDAPYLKADYSLCDKWRARLGYSAGKRIGIAWSVGVPHEDDYPRSIPAEQLARALFSRDGHASLIPVQQQGQFADFADCAALMSCLDEIVTIDTAAVHLAGAIGHPRVTLLLSHWASWRWQLPLYRNVRICQQDAPGDWESAFRKIGHG